jgi:hypothetical protein
MWRVQHQDLRQSDRSRLWKWYTGSQDIDLRQQELLIHTWERVEELKDLKSTRECLRKIPNRTTLLYVPPSPSLT